jgi:hypothetical protein
VTTLEHLQVGTLRIEYAPEDRSTADVMAEACGKALRLAKAGWGLDPPADCRLYVMTSWRDFVFRSAPWPWKVALALSYPLWSGRVRQMWPISAGWTQRYGRRTAIGIKPPRLLDVSDKSVGVHMFVEEKDPVAKIGHLACHELTHAASAHLRLPAWLNEGLATVTVDRFLGKATIRPESLDLVQRVQPKAPPPPYRQLHRFRGETLAYHAVRGYWIVRLLEETHPGFVRSLLTSRQAATRIERQVAIRLNLEPAMLWAEIDARVHAHFSERGVPDADSR